MDANQENRRLTKIASPITSYSILSQLYYIEEDDKEIALLTDTTFSIAVWEWLSKSPLGIFIVVLSLVFATSMLTYCIWRTAYAPDNQDTVLRNFVDGRDPTSIIEVEANSIKEKKKRRLLGALATKVKTSDAVQLSPIDTSTKQREHD
jgi:hypothetical protein